MPNPRHFDDFLPIETPRNLHGLLLGDRIVSKKELPASPGRFAYLEYRALDGSHYVFSDQDGKEQQLPYAAALVEMKEGAVYRPVEIPRAPEPEPLAHIQGDGSRHYGNWDVLEICERYGDSAATTFALKHVCRPPKRMDGIDEKRARALDLRKAATYLNYQADQLDPLGP